MEALGHALRYLADWNTMDFLSHHAGNPQSLPFLALFGLTKREAKVAIFF
jgi:hypothetical protein